MERQYQSQYPWKTGLKTQLENNSDSLKKVLLIQRARMNPFTPNTNAAKTHNTTKHTCSQQSNTKIFPFRRESHL